MSSSLPRDRPEGHRGLAVGVSACRPRPRRGARAMSVSVCPERRARGAGPKSRGPSTIRSRGARALLRSPRAKSRGAVHRAARRRRPFRRSSLRGSHRNRLVAAVPCARGRGNAQATRSQSPRLPFACSWRCRRLAHCRPCPNARPLRCGATERPPPPLHWPRPTTGGLPSDDTKGRGRSRAAGRVRGPGTSPRPATPAQAARPYRS